MDGIFVVSLLVFLGSLGLFSFYVKRRKAPEPPLLQADKSKIDDIFKAAGKREEIRIIEIRGKIAEAEQAAKEGNPEPAKEQLSAGWSKARETGAGGKIGGLVVCFLALFLRVSLALSIAGCISHIRPVEPSARPLPSSFTLAPPGSVSSPSLLPEAPPPSVIECTLESGAKVGGGSYLSPGLGAALGGELERLSALPFAYQQAEREASALVLKDANREIQRQAEELSAADRKRYAAEVKAYQWRRAAPALFFSGAAAGLLLGAFLISL